MLLIKASKFNLAPRGYGRSSYRLAEIVQMGRIPVYMYDDAKWLPYQNTNISFSTFGFIGRMDYMRRLYWLMVRANNSQFEEKMEQVRRVRQYYTYEGVLQQIDFFFRDPLGPHGGYLRCERVPDRDHQLVILAFLQKLYYTQQQYTYIQIYNICTISSSELYCLIAIVLYTSMLNKKMTFSFYCSTNFLI